jgi:DNA-binding NarL/FixJ family response regulator
VSHRSVVIAHREPLVAEALATALGRYPLFVPIQVATTSDDAELRGRRADAAAIDGRLPGAARAASRLRRWGVRVVMLDGAPRREEDGVSVPPDASVATLAAALAPGVSEPRSRLSSLTERERQILSLVARGMVGKQVARELGISPKTVEQHKTRIFHKLDVSNQAAAAAVLSAQGGLAWSPSTT